MFWSKYNLLITSLFFYSDVVTESHKKLVRMLSGSYSIWPLFWAWMGQCYNGSLYLRDKPRAVSCGVEGADFGKDQPWPILMKRGHNLNVSTTATSLSEATACANISRSKTGNSNSTQYFARITIINSVVYVNLFDLFAGLIPFCSMFSFKFLPDWTECTVIQY